MRPVRRRLALFIVIQVGAWLAGHEAKSTELSGSGLRLDGAAKQSASRTHRGILPMARLQRSGTRLRQHRTVARGSIPRLVSLLRAHCRHSRSAVATLSNGVTQPLRQTGLANRFWFLCFCGSCHLLFTTSHRIPQAIMKVSQAVHERPEDKRARFCACG